MALIKFGGGVVGMAGSIAGTTFARNRGGSYARGRTKPINKNTVPQQVARDALTQLVERWFTTVTSTQRLNWLTYAQNVSMKNRLGESILLSGMNHYVRSNSLRQQTGNTIIDAAPTDFTLAEKDGTFAMAISEATQQISFTFDNTLDWANEDDGFMFIYVSNPQNATVNFFAGGWQYGETIAGDSGTPPTSPKVLACPDAVVEGQKLFAYARICRADGRMSEKFFCSKVVAA